MILKLQLFPFIVDVKSLSHVWLFVTAWTVAYQTLPSMRFSRQEYWSGLPFSRESSPPRDWAQVSCIAGRCFTVWATREAHWKGYIGGFQILVVMNKAAINTCVHGFVWTEVFNSKLNLEGWSSVNEMDREKLNILDRENTAWLFREFHPDQHEVWLYRKE